MLRSLQCLKLLHCPKSAPFVNPICRSRAAQFARQKAGVFGGRSRHTAAVAAMAGKRKAKASEDAEAPNKSAKSDDVLVHPGRVRSLRDGDVKAGPVIYWYDYGALLQTPTRCSGMSHDDLRLAACTMQDVSGPARAGQLGSPACRRACLEDQLAHCSGVQPGQPTSWLSSLSLLHASLPHKDDLEQRRAPRHYHTTHDDFLSAPYLQVPEYLVAGARQFGFMLRGLKLMVPKLEALNIPFFMVKGDPIQTIPELVEKTKAACLVTDFASLRLGREWRDKACLAQRCNGWLSNIMPSRQICAGRLGRAVVSAPYICSGKMQ